MNKWRHVSSDSDGHQINQCLACKSQWTGNTHGLGGWNYCPICGVRFNGRHECVPHDDRHPEWYGKWKRLEPHFWWVIEARWVYKDPERKPGTWQRHCSYPGFTSARQVHERLILERAAANQKDPDELAGGDWLLKSEYRVRISHDARNDGTSWWHVNGGLWG